MSHLLNQATVAAIDRWRQHRWQQTATVAAVAAAGAADTIVGLEHACAHSLTATERETTDLRWCLQPQAVLCVDIFSKAQGGFPLDWRNITATRRNNDMAQQRHGATFYIKAT